jgi:uncharacterized RDD family membrane protein YckC
MEPDSPDIAGSTPCGLFRRLLAICYDGIVVLALLLLAGLFALPLDPGGQQAMRDPVYTIYLLAVWYLYLAWCWRRAGMTLGMRAWRLRLATADGQRPGWGACLLRFAVALAGVAALGMGLLWALFDRQRRCWHDLASRTRLVVIPRHSLRSPQHQDGDQGQGE